MTIQDLGAIGDLVGGVGVILSLVGLRAESSSVEERARFQALFASLMSTYENNFVQHQLGAVHRDTLKVSRESLRRLLDSPDGRDWWERHSLHHLAPEFRAAVERELSERAA